jgi:hypothetical protein
MQTENSENNAEIQWQYKKQSTTEENVQANIEIIAKH